ncbi:hypothetical protein K458DRAFT_343898 [Lentithecium fluviatile CBS 122367]|uniref:Zn(2)-C6 fungal-type domain-containing protein n=1 Tax=Lentithecium fluviatile CBS 122367 TaxID=1168545 RepID=A0A6G1ISP5_9PLEO|nr:hypothetical protein K458DRAFT_343898 [Lentithecium fluviatile CBS 122367]
MSQIRSERGTQKGQPRLRFACNQCYAAKLKCTGEHNGCTRCRTLRTECVYTESRVGKVRGIRRKKRQDQQSLPAATSSTVTSQDQRTGDVTTSSALSLRVPPPTPSAPGTMLQPRPNTWVPNSSWGDAMLNLDESLTFEAILEDGTIASCMNTSSISDVANCSYQITETANSTGFGQSLSNYLPPSAFSGQQTHRGRNSLSLYSPFPTPPSTTNSAHATPPEETPKQDLSKLDSRCVLASTQILVTLENYLLSELKALDLILTTVSKAADDLKKLVQLQHESRCDRCIILFTIIMLQIVALLEAGSNTAADNGSDIMSDILTGTQPTFGPSFGLGAFVLTSEEQKSWRSRIVTKEYRHVGDILSSLMVLARLGPRDSSNDPIAVDSRLKCLGSIEQRLKEMLAKEGVANM